MLDEASDEGAEGNREQQRSQWVPLPDPLCRLDDTLTNEEVRRAVVGPLGKPVERRSVLLERGDNVCPNSRNKKNNMLI
jgi:hypothetical protein